eukprot:6953099-Prymnesium_polylepis.2
MLAPPVASSRCLTLEPLEERGDAAKRQRPQVLVVGDQLGVAVVERQLFLAIIRGPRWLEFAQLVVEHLRHTVRGGQQHVSRTTARQRTRACTSPRWPGHAT